MRRAQSRRFKRNGAPPTQFGAAIEPQSRRGLGRRPIPNMNEPPHQGPGGTVQAGKPLATFGYFATLAMPAPVESGAATVLNTWKIF